MANYRTTLSELLDASQHGLRKERAATNPTTLATSHGIACLTHLPGGVIRVEFIDVKVGTRKFYRVLLRVKAGKVEVKVKFFNAMGMPDLEVTAKQAATLRRAVQAAIKREKL